jgi:two-component system chemotaxis response regulator CheB/chemosensory pili system protein ChpB (putative protein-glutamate methylesterase)
MSMRPRVALVFGDPDSAGHLRDAVTSHVEIVYEARAADFDAARLRDSQATAALVNLDGCDWLDAVEARLHDAGVAVVFNDPEISSKLDGWEQARWLRHLTAKLSGNNEYDPPRPAAASSQPVVAAAEEVDADHGHAVGTEVPAADAAPVVERPLSPAEIESMTADFGAVPEAAVPAGSDEAPVATSQSVEADGAEAPESTGVEPELEMQPPAMAVDDTATVSSPDAQAGDPEPGDTDALDVDTEALSAMIDARLAEAENESEGASGGSPEVWRVVEGGSVSAVEPPSAVPAQEVSEPAAIAAAVQPAAPVDDSDVLGALPSLDDWQLVDPDAPIAPAASAKRDEPPQPSTSLDFAGLELVPVEMVAPPEVNSEPVERWMHVEKPSAPEADKQKAPASSNAGGDHA